MAPQGEVGRQAGVQTITVKGQRLRVMIRPGDGIRTPLLLMNGLGARLEVFQPFLDELDPTIEVISFDVPGIGGSPPPALLYNPASLACLVSGMLDALGCKQVDVLGVSWGGWLAQQFAFQHSTRCQRLILVCTGPGVLMVPGSPNALISMLTPWRFADPSYLENIAPKLFGGDPEANPTRLREFVHALQMSWPSGYFYQLFAGVGWTSLPWLWLLRQPALILAGDDDHMVPLANAKMLERMIPRSERYIYHGGHLDIVTDPKEIMRVIELFLSRSRN